MNWLKINYLENAKFAAEKKGKTLNEMIKEKADSLGFTAIYPTQQ